MEDGAVKPLISQVACRIIEYVVRENFPAGFHIAEQTLANYCRVHRNYPGTGNVGGLAIRQSCYWPANGQEVFPCYGSNQAFMASSESSS